MANITFDEFIANTAKESEKIPPADKTQRITATIPTSTLEKVNRYTEASKRSRSEIVTELIENGFKYILSNS